MVGFVHVMDLIMIFLEELGKGPAPTNMEIPEYKFVDANTIKIG